MSAIFEQLLLYPFKLSLDAVAPSELVVLFISIVGLSLIFANGIVYSCMVETDVPAQRIEHTPHRRNISYFRNHKLSALLTHLGIVSVILIAIGAAVIFGLMTTQKRWIIENMLWRLLICLLSATGILSEIPGISKYLRWSDSFRSFHRASANILIMLITGRS